MRIPAVVTKSIPGDSKRRSANQQQADFRILPPLRRGGEDAARRRLGPNSTPDDIAALLKHLKIEHADSVRKQ